MPAPVSTDVSREIERLYAAHRPALLAHCLRLTRDPVTAEDLVQEAFARFIARRPALPADVNALAYLRTTARNLWYRQLRDTRVVPVARVDDLAGASDELEVDPVRAALLAEQQGQVQRAAARLGPRHRRALALRELDDRSYAEVGNALDTGEPAVAQLLFRARASLRREVRREQVDVAALPAACRSLLPLLSAYVDGSAAAAERSRVEAHLEGCTACRASLETFRDAGRRFRVGGPLAPLTAALGRIAGLGEDGPLTGPAAAVVAAVASIAIAGGGLVAGHRLAAHSAAPHGPSVSAGVAAAPGAAGAAGAGGASGSTGAASGAGAGAAGGGAAAGSGPAAGAPGAGGDGTSAGAAPGTSPAGGAHGPAGAGVTANVDASGATVGVSAGGASVGVSGSGSGVSVGATVPVGGSAASAGVSIGGPAATVAATTPSLATPAVTVPAVSTPAVSTPVATVPAVTTPAVTVPAVTLPPLTISVSAPTVSLPGLP